ncbi:hypothetical protein [Lunatibacter salilacus]|uniref:hypothetical protein n=1 Tax=Lunatibacter salilacus TaxID=2483804 RepID=UPI00131AC3E3|nr:hypothetical protein [Lunatibacter salilacus]
MEQFLKFLKTEAIGGIIIRLSLVGLLLFGGFTKLILIGALENNIFGAVLVAAIETLAAFGLLIHYRMPIYGIAGALLALLAIFIRLVYSYNWVKDTVLGTDSYLNAINSFLGTYNNGLFHIVLLIGSAIYCLGNSYKEYIRQRLTQPWPH